MSVKTYMQNGSAMVEIVGSTQGDWVRHDDHEKLVLQARAVLAGVSRGDCFCEHGIGNPMSPKHAAACDAAMAFLAGTRPPAPDLMKTPERFEAKAREEVKRLERMITMLRGELGVCLVASCTCLTKTPVLEYHDKRCRFRRISAVLAQTNAGGAAFPDLMKTPERNPA